ncbi:MAG: aldehyde ferredoxin oxidoreductase, partial [Candidatus Heimdallarchaeota archaeon]|nr:aldehyde ferredoxin oxidoreductase [Candidatus Heimdallarchaeota archaeon]
MTVFGNTGKILEVDLTNEKTSVLKPDPEIYRNYVGGSGLAARLLFDQLTEELDPLSPENPLGFFTGPLSGTKTP